MKPCLDGSPVTLETAPGASALEESARGRLAWQALSSLDVAVSIVDIRSAEQPLVYVNQALCSLTGYAEAELLGRNCRLLQHPGADPAAIDALRRGVAALQPVSVVLRNLRRNGTSFWNALQIVPMVNADGTVTHYAGYQHDVSESNLMAHAVLSCDDQGPVEARARFDRALTDALRQQAAGRQHHVVVVLAPADGAADWPLPQRMAVTSRLQPFMSQSAALCFLDAGEIALLTPVRDDETPGWVAEKAHDLVKDLWPCGAGLAEPFTDGREAAELLACARAAAGRSAAAGAAGPCHADPVRDAHDRRARVLLRDVARALCGEQFRVVYQPIVNLVTRQITGLEALLRWRHPSLGEVSPGEFIGHLERLPVIGEVTQWVLATSLPHIARWSLELGRPLRLSVNVPAEVLLDGAFVDRALAAARRHGVPPGQLEVELTERSLTSADGPAVTRLRELREHGVRVAIDDFGTGWSSLSYLAQLPVDTLKVDLQFTRGVLHSRTDAAISRMTVELARGLGLRCVAEGIETAEQLQFFADLECDEGQGYLFARPLEVVGVDRFITEACALARPAPAVRVGVAKAPPAQPQTRVKKPATLPCLP